MRLPLVCMMASVALGCGELEGASEWTEAPAPDAAAFDVAPSETSTLGANDLDGYFVDDIIPQTRALYRLDSASDPTHPRIVFVSSAEKVALPCELFKTDGWTKRLPAGAMIHVLTLGATTPATLAVRAVNPPATDGARVSRVYAPNATLEDAVDGTVTITAVDVSRSRGSFDAMFQVFYEDDPVPYKQRVRGSFDAPSCAVD